jgi:hypothetical protein
MSQRDLFSALQSNTQGGTIVKVLKRKPKFTRFG